MCVALMATAMVGCGEKKSNSTEYETQKESQAAVTVENKQGSSAEEDTPAGLEPMEISVAIWGIQDAFDSAKAKDDTIFNDLCEKFNLTIKPVGVTWNDYQEKNKVWAASGTLPDVFVDALATDNFGLYKTWAEQGIIKEIPSDLSAYSNLNTLFHLSSVQALALEDKYYMIPRGGDLTISISEASGMSRAVMYRKDWAAEAGYSNAPATYEELVEMTKAMMEKHPDAVGIALNGDGYMGTLALDLFPELANPSSWVYENNQWLPSFTSEKTIAYMERVQKLYQDGILDPDFITQKDGDGLGRFMGGKACVMLGGDFDPIVFMDSNPEVKNIEDALGFIAPFVAADGNAYVFTNTPYWSETYISAQVDDAKMERILMLMDYMYSHEFAVIMSNGIEGVDWEMTENGGVSLLKDEVLGDKYPISSCFGYLASWFSGIDSSDDVVVSSNPIIASYKQLKNDMDAYERDNCKAAPINFNVLLMNNDKKSEASSLWQEFISATNNFIIGKEDARTAWENMVADFNAKGLQEAITSVTEQAAAEGIQP